MVALGTAAFSQNCFKISNFLLSPSNGSGIRTITFDYVTDGQKSLFTQVKCNGVVIFDSCFKTNGSGSQSYPFADCNAGMLDITLTPYTGNCGAAQCAPTLRSINGGPLPIKLSGFSAVRSKQVVALNGIQNLNLMQKNLLLKEQKELNFAA